MITVEIINVNKHFENDFSNSCFMRLCDTRMLSK